MVVGIVAEEQMVWGGEFAAQAVWEAVVGASLFFLQVVVAPVVSPVSRGECVSWGE